MPAQNGGKGSCFLPKTDKQVSHSDSDELTPGSSVRRVINVAYLLGTELCVFSAPPPPKENVDFPEWEHSFFSLSLGITATFIFFLPEEGEISYERGCVAENHLTSLSLHSRAFTRGYEMQWRRNIAVLSWQPPRFAAYDCSVWQGKKSQLRPF